MGLPAFVEGRYFDVLAANNLAYALLSPNLEVGRNRLRDVFLDPAEQALYADRGNALVRLVAGFRRSIGNDVDDPRVIQLVGELSLSSERFRRIWARHDVQSREGMPTRIHHPQVGDLTLSREKLGVGVGVGGGGGVGVGGGGAEGQTLAIYHAEPGTTSADKLALLASLAKPITVVGRRRDPSAPDSAAT